MTTLVHCGQPHEHDLDTLRLRVTELEALFAERSTTSERMKTDLAAFKARYRRDVGELHEELEELELAIAEAELGELARQAPRATTGSPPTKAPIETAPRFTSDAVRKMFRDVARTIHPDLANDAFTKDRRHALMIEANRAYALGDEERLRWVLQAWERSPEAVQASDPDATRLRLARRIQQVEEQLELCASELEVLKDTSLWKLKTMVDEAAAKGKDLVADTVRRLKRDIMVARNRLDAIQSRP